MDDKFQLLTDDAMVLYKQLRAEGRTHFEIVTIAIQLRAKAEFEQRSARDQR